MAKAKSHKELMKSYGVRDYHTWRRWLEPIKKKLSQANPTGKKLLTPKQVEIITEHLGECGED